MFGSGKHMLSRQRAEVVAGMVVMESIQKAAAAQENAFAGL
ncbi:hypothetical protein [Mesorhizobium sp.]|nr:hypothetical protein [Mesorhizobium sp.]